VRIPRSRRAFGKVLGKPVVLLATVIGFLLIGACAAVEAAVVATFGHGGSRPASSSPSSPSAVSPGLAFGHIPMGPGRWRDASRRRRRPRASVFVVGDISPSTPWWVGACLLVAGVGVAPALAVMFAMTSASVKFSETAEAYGWIGTGQLIGAALGSAVAGFLIDASAPPARTRRRPDSRSSRSPLRAGLPRPARPRREPDPRHRTGPRHHVRSSSTTDSARP
jgi:MFS family permease